MDFSLTSDQVFIRDTLRKLMQRECPRETVHALDEQGTFPKELLAKIAEIGFCGLNTPEEFGGFGLDLLGTVIAIEEIAVVSPALAALFATTSLFGGRVISQFGSPAQQQELLPQIAKGALKFSPAMPAEFALNNIQVTSRSELHSLNGQADNVLFANLGGADYLLVQAASAEQTGNISLFLVPLDAPGLQIQVIPTLGMRGTGLGNVSFDQVQVSQDQVLGGQQFFGNGKAQSISLVALDQICGAAIGLGISQGAYAYALNYARERSQFGKVLLQFEAVEHMLVDLVINIQSARWQLFHACWLADQGKPFAMEAAVARMQAGSLARQAGLQCVHILGGYGYMAEYDAQRSMRDGLVLFQGSESVELLKTSIGKQIHSL